MATEEVGSTNLTGTLSLTDMRMTRIPELDVLPPSSQRLPTKPLPLVGLGFLHHPSLRSQLVDEIGFACREIGFFQVINHGISAQVVEGALEAASEFFNLPADHDEKRRLISDDFHNPVRYSTSVTDDAKGQVRLARDFLKHYSHPLSRWLHLWPSTPSSYREKMGAHAEAMQKLSMDIMEAVLESLGLKPGYMKEELEGGMQVMAVNCYFPCPEPELALGIAPHTDHGLLTILIQDSQGLEIMDKQGRWMPVPAVEGALLVLVGDHLEVMSNGRYKSVLHKARVSSQKRRLSIASVHSLDMNQKVSPAPELVDEQHPLAYTDTSVSDFLRHISSNCLKGTRYIETLKTAH